jgi:hypothetical protein
MNNNMTEGNVFEGLFANHGSKIVSILFSVFTAPINIAMAYGVIWFETYGTGNRRTLVNKMERNKSIISKIALKRKSFLQLPMAYVQNRSETD